MTPTPGPGALRAWLETNRSFATWVISRAETEALLAHLDTLTIERDAFQAENHRLLVQAMDLTTALREAKESIKAQNVLMNSVLRQYEEKLRDAERARAEERERCAQLAEQPCLTNCARLDAPPIGGAGPWIIHSLGCDEGRLAAALRATPEGP